MMALLPQRDAKMTEGLAAVRLLEVGENVGRDGAIWRTAESRAGDASTEKGGRSGGSVEDDDVVVGSLRVGEGAFTVDRRVNEISGFAEDLGE